MNIEKLKTSVLEHFSNYSESTEKNEGCFEQDLGENKLYLESLLESDAIEEVSKESAKALFENISYCSDVGCKAYENGDFELAANKYEEASQFVLAFAEMHRESLGQKANEILNRYVNFLRFFSELTRGEYLLSRKLKTKNAGEFTRKYLNGYELIADTVDKYFDSLSPDTQSRIRNKLIYYSSLSNEFSELLSLEEFQENAENSKESNSVVSDIKRIRNALGFIVWKLNNSAKKTEYPGKSEEEIEYSKFQASLSEYPDWDREEQIRRNQGAIKLVRSWLSEEISEEERQKREEHFERFKGIVDAQRPPGHKLYSEE